MARLKQLINGCALGVAIVLGSPVPMYGQASVSTVVTSADPQDPTASCDDLLDGAGIDERVEVCSVYVQMSGPANRVLSIAFADITATTPDAIIQVPSGLGGSDLAPSEDAISTSPFLVCDSFVTIGSRAVAIGESNCTTTDPDFDTMAFNTAGVVGGGWYCSDHLSEQGVPDDQGTVLIGQFTYRYGTTVSGSITVFTSPGAVPVPATFECLTTATACSDVGNCADVESNGVRDDGCVWWECAAGVCLDQSVPFADVGGAFGACPPDSFANIHDKNHALSCFAGTNTCESINVDAGGPFGDCVPDGFCNIHDANHALSAFAGTSTCSCPSGPMPEYSAPVAGEAGLRVVASGRNIRPGETVQVRVFVEDLTAALRSYQLGIGLSGGSSGQLTLTRIWIEEREDWVFAGKEGAFDAFNSTSALMLAGLNVNQGVKGVGGYLATFMYKASADASGTFVFDSIQSGAHTILVAPSDQRIQVRSVTPATVAVQSKPTHRK